MTTIRSGARLSRRPWGIDREKRAMLKRVNDGLALEKPPRILHPTKGFRKVNPKLTVASLYIQAVKTGQVGYELQAVRGLIMGAV